MMPKVPSIAIIDDCPDGINIWHVTTRKISFNESRLVGAWNIETYDPDEISNLIEDRYQFATIEADKILRKLNILQSNIIDIKSTLQLANEKVLKLKSILDFEQSTRKKYFKLVEPNWPEFESDLNLDALSQTDKNKTIRALLIARWFESIFTRWDKFEEIRLGSLFLREKSSSEFSQLEIITKT